MGPLNMMLAFSCFLLHSVAAISQQACSSGEQCDDIFGTENELMMLQFRSKAKSRADTTGIEYFQTVGQGCCSGSREEANGKLWAGATDNADACKSKCLEFETCGAVEYGWTDAHTHWCFIWSNKQSCSSLDSGNGKCGPGGSTGVQAYRFSPGMDLQEAAEKAEADDSKKKAKEAEQLANDIRAAAAVALKEAQAATAAAEEAELKAAEAAEHVAYDTAQKRAKDAEDAKARYQNATKFAEAMDNEATNAAEAAEKLLEEEKSSVLHADKMSRKAHRMAEKAHKAAEAAKAAARESVDAQEAASSAAEKAAEEREEAERAEAERQEAQKTMLSAKQEAAAADAVAKSKADAARKLIDEKHREKAESEKERADEEMSDEEKEKQKKADEEKAAETQKFKIESSLHVKAPQDFHSLGAGCCLGARSRHNGKLWAGERSSLTSCAAKCREFENCGAIEYGWEGLSNHLWCFIWSSEQSCSYLEVGPGACGNGGSDGVHAFRFRNETKQASIKDDTKQSTIKNDTKQATIKNDTKQATTKSEAKQATIKNDTKQATIKNDTKQATTKSEAKQATTKNETTLDTIKSQSEEAASNPSSEASRRQARSHKPNHQKAVKQHKHGVGHERKQEPQGANFAEEQGFADEQDSADEQESAPQLHVSHQPEEQSFADEQDGADEQASAAQPHASEQQTAHLQETETGQQTEADMTAHKLPLTAPVPLEELKKKAAAQEAEKHPEKTHRALDVDSARELESEVIGWDELGEGCCYGQRNELGGKLRSESNVLSLKECQDMCLEYPNCGSIEFSKHKPFSCFIWSDQHDCSLLPMHQCATANEKSTSVTSAYKVKRRSPHWTSYMTNKQVIADEKYIDFQDYGSGCCLGKRDANHGKLFEGPLATLNECQEMCRQSEDCGAIEYGGKGTGSSDWCFVWSTHQTCTDMAWGEDDCGQGGNEGVHVWKFLKRRKNF